VKALDASDRQRPGVEAQIGTDAVSAGEADAAAAAGDESNLSVEMSHARFLPHPRATMLIGAATTGSVTMPCPSSRYGNLPTFAN